MALSPVERVMARRQVDAEINTDPVTITPMRQERIPDGVGGFKLGPLTSHTPVEVLIMPAKRRMSDMQVNTELGDVVDYPFWVLARHSADLRPDDQFTWQGDKFEVKQIHIKAEVSVTAGVDYYGGTKNG